MSFNRTASICLWDSLIRISVFPPPPHQGGRQRRQLKDISDGAFGVRPPGISIFSLFQIQEPFLRQLVMVREGISIHDTHIINAFHPSLTEVAY